MARDPQIDKLIQDAKTEKFRQGEAKGLIETIGDEIKKQLAPLFTEHSKEITKTVQGAFKDLKIDVPKSDAPQVNIPAYPTIPPFPEMKAPVVHVPAPIVNIPAPVVNVSPAAVNFPERMKLDRSEKPFPVVMMDMAGKPMNFAGLSGGVTGGRGDFFTIKDIQTSAGLSIIDNDGFVKVTGSFTATSSGGSTQLVDSSNNVYTLANPFPTSATISLPAGQGDAATATRVVIAGNSDASVVINSGTLTAVTGITNSVQASIIDSSGVAYSGSNPVPVTGTVVVSSVTATVGAANVDSSGVMYSGSNPFPITIAGDTDPVGPGDAATAQRVVIAGNSDASVVVNSGTLTTVTTLTGITNTVNARLDSPDGPYSAANPLPVTFSAAASQNVNVSDGQASTITSHWDPTADFRGLDTTNLRTINYVSGYNSTTATLGSGAAFTGFSEDIKDYSVVQVNVFADQASATDGLSVQQSSDGSNWDITDTYTIAASTGKTFSFQVAARYFRVVYTNGGTIQGAFRLQAVLHQTVSKNSSQRPGDGLSNENDFEQVSAYLGALNASGTWDRLRTGGFDSLGALRVSQATDSVNSVVVNSGTITAVTGITNTVAIALTDSSGVQYSGSNPFIVDANDSLGQGDAASAIRVVVAGNSDASVVVNSGTITTVTTVTGVTNSLQTAIIDSGGVQYSGSNPVPITLISGSLSTTTVLYTRQTNPTAVAADYVPQAGDDLGRIVTRPIQVRDLIGTAYVTTSTGTETTLLAAGGAGVFLDLISLIATNNSSAAVQLDIRATTAGNIVNTLYIPANATTGWTPPVPWPQDNVDNNWTVDMPDVTGTTVSVSALFTKEV